MWRPWPLDLKFSEMLNIAPKGLSDSQKLLPGTLKLSYGSRTAFLLTFGHLLTFDLWTSNFQKCLTLPQWSLTVTNLLPGTFEWRYGSKTKFLPQYTDPHALPSVWTTTPWEEVSHILCIGHYLLRFDMFFKGPFHKKYWSDHHNQTWLILWQRSHWYFHQVLWGYFTI